MTDSAIVETIVAIQATTGIRLGYTICNEALRTGLAAKYCGVPEAHLIDPRVLTNYSVDHGGVHHRHSHLCELP